ncbi:hypothetical protein EJ04DRAFT_572155 [Polyplosphaeria fusca]|uniref:Uncharacterized protein n=1 Tax=Polyplosphaeria fusca TaxID=682080 RepID=A0A9P4RD11_9PLEO|nr:hypothetical protein EJ04DRAFT_572155 [Polyplosphaeria fusca]
MAAYGKPLNLLDERNLDFQDVTGNVQPLPTLLPYQAYQGHVILYKTNIPHEVFISQLQNCTDRAARHDEHELWTWVAQWEVVPETTHLPDDPEHATKKPRLDHSLAEGPGSPKLPSPPPLPDTQTRKPIFTSINPHMLAPDLIQEEEMLRVLIDIVQARDHLVPNVIEFMYRWIDFFEGHGHALKCALRGEIPSLWDFESHPRLMPEDSVRIGKDKKRKPSVKTLEDQIEQSERMQYHEPTYALKVPKIEDPLTALINIPKDPKKKNAYYGACFRSRHRAIGLLVAAGVSLRQIGNYIPGQEAHPKQTSEAGEGKGLENYNNNIPFANEVHKIDEKHKRIRAKYAEVRLNRSLAGEARRANMNAAFEAPEGSSKIIVPPPIIPHTPSYAKTEGVTPTGLSSAATPLPRYTQVTVPSALNGRIRSLTRRPVDPTPTMKITTDPMKALATTVSPEEESDDDEDDEDDEMNEESEEIDDDSVEEDEDEEIFMSFATSAALGRLGQGVPAAAMAVPLGPETTQAMQAIMNWNTQAVPVPAVNHPARTPLMPFPWRPSATPVPVAAVPTSQTPAGLSLTQSPMPPVAVQVPQHSPLPAPMQLSPSKSGIQRKPPSPIKVGPLSALTNMMSLKSAPGFEKELSVLLYFPKIIAGSDYSELTDALMLGYMLPNSADVSFDRAVFLKMDLDDVLLSRTRAQAFHVIESYAGTAQQAFVSQASLAPQKHAYDKLAQAYSIISGCKDREAELTKRWKVTAGPLMDENRGSVWEGYGAKVVGGVVMTGEERKGAITLFISLYGVDEEARRKAEMNELMEEGDEMEEDE